MLFLINTKKKKKSENITSAGTLLCLTPLSSHSDAAWPACLVNVFDVSVSKRDG